MQWTVGGSVFGAVCDVVYEMPCGTAERICAKFTWKTCLIPRADEFQCQGRSMFKVTRDRSGIFQPFRWPACDLCFVRHLQPLVLGLCLNIVVFHDCSFNIDWTDKWLNWLQQHTVDSTEVEDASLSELVTQCENLRDDVRKAEVQWMLISVYSLIQLHCKLINYTHTYIDVRIHKCWL